MSSRHRNLRESGTGRHLETNTTTPVRQHNYSTLTASDITPRVANLGAQIAPGVNGVPATPIAGGGGGGTNVTINESAVTAGGLYQGRGGMTSGTTSGYTSDAEAGMSHTHHQRHQQHAPAPRSSSGHRDITGPTAAPAAPTGSNPTEDEFEGLYVSLVLLTKDHQRLSRALEQERLERDRLAEHHENDLVRMEDQLMARDEEIRSVKRRLHEEQQIAADAQQDFEDQKRELQRRNEELAYQNEQRTQQVRDLEQRLKRYQSVHQQIRTMATSDDEFGGGSSGHHNHSGGGGYNTTMF